MLRPMESSLSVTAALALHTSVLGFPVQVGCNSRGRWDFKRPVTVKPDSWSSFQSLEKRAWASRLRTGLCVGPGPPLPAPRVARGSSQRALGPPLTDHPRWHTPPSGSGSQIFNSISVTFLGFSKFALALAPIRRCVL